jgi:transcriptional regulator with XRE-family HTH domain
MIAFGRALKELRVSARLSQETLASSVDVDVEHIAGMERGEREPTLVMLFKLAAALEVDPSVLIAHMERKLR